MRVPRKASPDHGGSQNHPPSVSQMIAAVPFSASAAVKRQIRAARSSWSASKTQAMPDRICKIQASRQQRFQPSRPNHLVVKPVKPPSSLQLWCRQQFYFGHQHTQESIWKSFHDWFLAINGTAICQHGRCRVNDQIERKRRRKPFSAPIRAHDD